METFFNFRDKTGKIIKAAPYQERLTSGTVARVEPNRKWFGKYGGCILDMSKFAHLHILICAGIF
jgi:hypothetical protein